jgi:DNA modification methylase
MDDMLQILQGDCLEQLKLLPAESVQCCVTSPPYWGLRDYGVDGQLGLEPTPGKFVSKMVDVFAEVWRVLKDDGTLWLNLGDSYANDGKWGGTTGGKHVSALHGKNVGRGKRDTGLKPKDMVGIPWRVAFALQDAGWYLRSDIIWHKPTVMPESVCDRPTKAHEYLFLLTRSPKYFYDADAIKEPASWLTNARCKKVHDTGVGFGHGYDVHEKPRVKKVPGLNPKAAENAAGSRQNSSFSAAVAGPVETRNKRTVWTVPSAPYKHAHFATFPPALVRPCVLAGSRPGDLVLDPFGGSGTTGQVALELGRRAVLIELNPHYVELIRKRTAVTPGLALG